MNHVQFLLLGVGNGAVFAALALALVVTYRSSGVVNFAASSVALYGAYTYAFLRQGKLLVPFPGLPVTVDVGGQWRFVPALVGTLVISGILGWLMYALVFRPLATAPPVARAVASLGIMTLITALMTARVGTSTVTVDAIFPAQVYEFGSARVPGDRLWFAVTVIALGVVVGVMYRYTRFGLATRAAATSQRGAAVSGISPGRVAGWNWVISGVIAGLAGVLIAPIVPLVPASYTLFIVPALAAAILGRFQSLGIAVAGGLVIGMLQSEAQLLSSSVPWLPASGLKELVPLILILLVLVVRAKPLPGRGEVLQQTLGRAPRPRHTLISASTATVVAVVALLVLQGSWRAALVMSLILGIISLSLVVVTGYAGQVSLVQLHLAAGAGYLLCVLQTSLGVPFPFSMLLAAAGATVIGVIVGLPALRVRGLPVAVVTLALAGALEAFWFRNNHLNGGFKGAHANGPTLFGLDLGIGSGSAFPRLAFCFLVLLILLAAGLGVAWLRRSRLGSEMLAIRANERSAAAAGVSVVRVKLVAFGIGAFIAGVGGALYAYRQGTVSYAAFTIPIALVLFTTVYLSGVTSVSGGINAGLLGAGGLVFVALDRWVSLGDWYDVIMALLLVATVVHRPEGISGAWHALADRLDARARRRRATSAAPSVPVEDGPAATPPTAQRSEPAAAGREDGPTVLGLERVSVAYQAVVAVSDVSLRVTEGTIVGLIGPNGAGKTTLIDAVTGFVESSGTITLDGRGMNGIPPHRRVRAGLGRTFQAIELYDDLSVEENVVVGLAGAGQAGRHHLDSVFDLLEITSLRESPAGDLSQGQRQLVSIARALVGNPRMLLLDEPAAGLDTTESAWLGDRLRTIRDAGTTILLIDHDIDLVLGLCDEVNVLDFGQLIASGPPQAIRADPAVTAAYLGASHDRSAPEADRHSEVEESTR